jgi:hypothetical protein
MHYDTYNVQDEAPPDEGIPFNSFSYPPRLRLFIQLAAFDVELQREINEIHEILARFYFIIIIF